MEETNYLKYKVLSFVNHIERNYNVQQLEYAIMEQILNREDYKNYFGKAFRFLKDNNFINVGKNSNGTDTVSSLTERGETVLKFQNWEEYENNIKTEKNKDKEIKDIDFQLKKATLKNLKLTPYISIAGLVFGLGSMIWSIMEKYHLIFVDITIYFFILISLLLVGIFLYRKI